MPEDSEFLKGIVVCLLTRFIPRIEVEILKKVVPKWGGVVTVWQKKPPIAAAASLMKKPMEQQAALEEKEEINLARLKLHCCLTHIIAKSGTKLSDAQDEASFRTEKLYHDGVKFVSKSWLSDSLEAHSLLDESYYLLSNEPTMAEESSIKDVVPKDKELPYIAPYACQRRTPLHHFHEDVVAIFDELVEYYDTLKDTGRSLAFSQASAVLKCIPRRLNCGEELQPIKFIGKSSIDAIDEVLKTGKLERLEAFRNDKHLTVIKELCKVWMIGPATAEKWVNMNIGITSIETAREALLNDKLKISRSEELGLKYHNDISENLTRAEIEQIAFEWQSAGNEVVRRFKTEGTMSFVIGGGYRRGKELSADVDLILTFKRFDENEEYDHLDWLKELIKHMETSKGYIQVKTLPSDFYSKKSDAKILREAGIDESSSVVGLYPWHGKMRRIDLFLAAPMQWAFAVAAWTGSGHFVRQMRRYALQAKQIHLSQHGAIELDHDGNIIRRIGKDFRREEEVFEMLGLEFIPPEYRNC